MHNSLKYGEIQIRTYLMPGDIGYIICQHGLIYKEEYNYKISFEAYVALGMCEFYKNYDSGKNRIWIAENKNKIIGFLLLMNRGDSAQLRFFLVLPKYRGIGLGKKLMELYTDFFHECGFKSSYLWTTNDLTSAANLYKRFGYKLTEEKDSTAFGKALKEQRYDLIV